MASSLGFGTFIPGASPVHTVNAQVKIILACAFSIAVFFVESWAGLGLLVVAVALLYVLARIRISRALAGLKPIAFILVFTVLVHAFSTSVGAGGHPGSEHLGSLGLAREWVLVGSFGITLDGLLRGLFVALRIGLLVAVCSLLTFTTSMMDLTDGLLCLLAPLRRIKVPVEDVATMVSIALRFIPTTVEEARCVVRAQQARCADFDSGKPLSRAKAWIPVFIPLFVRLFRRADELALAMDARCYRGEGRTHARVLAWGARDAAIVASVLAVLVALCVLL